MPRCFQLLRDGAAVPLAQIDEEMCRHFGAACDADRYFHGWYDAIGYDLAAGDSFDQIRARYQEALWQEADPVLAQIAAWLAENFTARSWWESKSHSKHDA